VQTIKTAIVVLLMMTVAYGCYVSFTGSPDPLPQHITDLIEESGSFDGLGVDPGLPGDFSDSGTAVAESRPSMSFPDMAGDSGAAEISFGDDPASAGPGFQDLPLEDAIESLANATSGSDGVRGGAGAANPDSSELGKFYPSTPAANLNLPDPRSLENLPAEDGVSENRPASWSSDPPGRNSVPSLEKRNRDDSSAAANTPPGMPKSSEPNLGLANAISAADRQFEADQPAEALATLSLFYDTPGLNESERQAMLSRLDPLAAIVIYSRRHLLEKPHRVGPSETLMEVASRFELPWQLLANINAIDDPVTVLPGTELKVVRGPFRAEVDLTRNELTIFLGELYAGRFPVRVGSNPAPQEGSYQVLDKQAAKTFYDRDGSPIPPEDPRNPYGKAWIDLGKSLCIHGSPNQNEAVDSGCISLKGRDADDLLGILGQGSTVTIRR